jgi:hypothetical protein
MLSFRQGDLIAVQDSSSPDLWKGANVDTNLSGHFPRHNVEVIAESFQLFMEMEREDVHEAELKEKELAKERQRQELLQEKELNSKVLSFLYYSSNLLVILISCCCFSPSLRVW